MSDLNLIPETSIWFWPGGTNRYSLLYCMKTTAPIQGSAFVSKQNMIMRTDPLINDFISKIQQKGQKSVIFLLLYDYRPDD